MQLWIWITSFLVHGLIWWMFSYSVCYWNYRKSLCCQQNTCILVFILNTYGFCNSENIGYNIIIYGLWKYNSFCRRISYNIILKQKHKIVIFLTISIIFVTPLTSNNWYLHHWLNQLWFFLLLNQFFKAIKVNFIYQHIYITKIFYLPLQVFNDQSHKFYFTFMFWL